jgi:hypothetical protein
MGRAVAGYKEKQSTTAERAKALVSERQKMLDPVEPTIRNEIPVFGRSLTTVTFKSNKEQRFIDNLVFFDGKMDHFFIIRLNLLVT